MREPGADWKATEPARRQAAGQRGPHKACMPKKPRSKSPRVTTRYPVAAPWERSGQCGESRKDVSKMWASVRSKKLSVIRAKDAYESK